MAETRTTLDNPVDPCAIAGHHVCGPSEIAHPDYRKVAERIAVALDGKGCLVISNRQIRQVVQQVILSELEKGGE